MVDLEEGEVETPSHRRPQLPAATAEGLRSQVEHYFSDENLAKDQFLRSKMDQNGVVPMSVISGFARVKALRPQQISEDEWEAMFESAMATSKTVKASSGKLSRLDGGSLPDLRLAGNKRKGGPGGGAASSEILINMPERDPDRCIFVGGLPQEATEILVYELFTQVGPVDRVSIPRAEGGETHKGFAFVQFAHGPVNSAEHSVNYAVRVMNDVRFFDRYLHVKKSTSSAGGSINKLSTAGPVGVGAFVDPSVLH